MSDVVVKFLTFLQVHHGLRVVAQCVVYPPQTAVRYRFGHQVVGLRRHAKVLLLENQSPLVVAQSLIGRSQVSVGSRLLLHATRLLRHVQSSLVPLLCRLVVSHQLVNSANHVAGFCFQGFVLMRKMGLMSLSDPGFDLRISFRYCGTK